MGGPTEKLGDRKEQKPDLSPHLAFCKVYMAASPWRLLLPADSLLWFHLSQAGPSFWAVPFLGPLTPRLLHPRAGTEQKKSFIKEHLLSDSIYVKFKNWQYSFMVIEIRSAVALREQRGWAARGRRKLSDDGNVLCLD